MSPRALPLFVCLIVIGVCGCGDKSASGPASGGGQPGEATPSARDVEDSASRLARGNRLLSQGDLDGADKIARDVLVREPNNGQAMMLAASVLLAREDVDGGVNMLQSAAEALPERSVEILAQATGVLWQSGRWDEAQASFIKLLREHPEYDDARRGLATLLNRRGFRFDANQQIRLLCRRPNVQVSIDELRCLVVPSRAFQPFQEKPRVEDPEWIRSQGELNVARALFGEGDVRDALKVLESSDLLARRHPAAVAFYGQVLLESQQFAEFQRWLPGVEEACRRYPAYWMAVGGWALRRQQPQQAVRMFGEAILREPGDIAAHDRMIQALTAAGNKAAAESFQERRVQVRAVVKLTGIILDNREIDAGAFEELAGVLKKVGRPFEANSWQTLAALRSGMGRMAMIESAQRQQALLASETVERTRANLLCGVDLSTYQFDLASLMPTSDGGGSTAGRQAVPPAGQPVFVNVAADSGLDFRYVNADPPKDRFFLMHEAVGSGIACLDYDRDGRVDLYVGQGACNAPDGVGILPNLLARNLGARFVTVTDQAGCDDRRYSLGVTAGDWNQDGFTDLVVGNMTGNRLLINQGDGTFVEQGGDALWNDGIYTSSLAIADVTGDHLPDIVEVTYLDDPKIFDPLDMDDNGIPVRFPGPLHFQACLDRVFVGQGDGTMRGQTLPTDSPSPGLGLVVTDIDGRGGNEIFVANDMKANHLWELDGGSGPNSPSFVDTAVTRGVAYGPSGTPLACMGIAAADYDENGFLDFHITNFYDQWSNHYMQNSDSLFDDLTLPFGLDESTHKMLGFGTEPIDFDNNSVIDLVTGNGHIDDLSHEGAPFEMPTQLFVGDRSTLRPVPVQGDPEYWQSGHLTRGVVTLDWNFDGRVDFAASDLKEPLVLMENRTDTQYNWVQFRLVGRSSERDAIGAKVTLELSGGRRLTQWVQSGDGYMSKNEALVCFGIGRSAEIDALTIRWPDGVDQSIEPMEVNRRWLIVQGREPFSMSAP